jgi:ketosteroid isomerase-like protein
MSQENVSVVRRSFEAFSRGGVEAVISGGFWSPEIVFDPSETGIPGLGVYRGSDEVRLFFEDDWFRAFPFEEWEIEFEELIDAGGDQVFAVSRQRGRGQPAGRERSLNSRISSRCAPEKSCGSTSTATERRPSKPPGSGSSEVLRGRCRRRT